jgi:hypothetical protein
MRLEAWCARLEPELEFRLQPHPTQFAHDFSSCWAVPSTLPPPWIHTITAARCATGGAHTLRYRQSSESSGWGAPWLAACGQRKLNAAASSAPSYAAGGCGGAQRQRPSGGAAYGTPRNSRTPVGSACPCSSPCSTCSTRPDDGALSGSLAADSGSPPAVALSNAGCGAAELQLAKYRPITEYTRVRGIGPATMPTMAETHARTWNTAQIAQRPECEPARPH